MIRRAFTLVELLVVISIIAVLIGILIPTVAHVRQAARATSTQSLLVELQSACEQYYQDFRSYPGPLSNNEVYAVGGGSLVVPPITAVVTPTNYPSNAAELTQWNNQDRWRISMSENLTLGLMGGLSYDAAVGAIAYNPTLVGTGPRTLAAAGMNSNRAKNPYISSTSDLAWRTVSSAAGPIKTGHFADGLAEANDSAIPEFVDRFQTPMPILYLRARVGSPSNFAWQDGAGNWHYYVITDTSGVRGRPAFGTAVQYDVAQIIGYVGSFTGTWPAMTTSLNAQEMPNSGYGSIGEGKGAVYWFGPDTANQGPYTPSELQRALNVAPFHGLFSMQPYPLRSVGDAAGETPAPANGYFANPAFTGAGTQPRGKDSYILISPGPDRVYGTADDITSFGAVMP